MTQARRLLPGTRATIAALFKRLDYPALGRIYCDEGGDVFWKAIKGPCRTLGITLAETLRGRRAYWDNHFEVEARAHSAARENPLRPNRVS